MCYPYALASSRNRRFFAGVRNSRDEIDFVDFGFATRCCIELSIVRSTFNQIQNSYSRLGFDAGSLNPFLERFGHTSCHEDGE